MVGEWEQMFQEYHNDAPDGLLRTTGVVAGLVSKIAKKFPNFEFPKKIQQFALSRTCFRMRALIRKLAADRAETLKAKRKVLDFIYSSEPSKNGKKVSKVLFLQICLFENSTFYVGAYRILRLSRVKLALQMLHCKGLFPSGISEFITENFSVLVKPLPKGLTFNMAMIQPSFTSPKRMQLKSILFQKLCPIQGCIQGCCDCNQA